jgi:hypothetical protein
MNRDLKEYRTGLVETVQKLNESYDKLIVTLSSGALGLSLVFLKDVVKEEPIQGSSLLISAWVLFVLSLTSVLSAMLFGIAANKKAVKQVDTDTIYHQKPGGQYSKLTTLFHYLGTVFLVVGLATMILFAYINMEAHYGKGEGKSPQAAIKTDNAQTTIGTRQEKLGTITTSPSTSDTYNTKEITKSQTLK